MKKLILFFSAILTVSCSSSKIVTGKEFEKRANFGKLQNEVHNTNNLIKVYVHGKRLSEVSYFHGGYISFYVNKPELDFGVE